MYVRGSQTACVLRALAIHYAHSLWESLERSMSYWRTAVTLLLARRTASCDSSNSVTTDHSYFYGLYTIFVQELVSLPAFLKEDYPSVTIPGDQLSKQPLIRADVRKIHEVWWGRGIRREILKQASLLLNTVWNLIFAWPYITDTINIDNQLDATITVY